MFYFCTYFDQHYLARGLAMYRSLQAHCSEFRLWVLCMDDTAYRILTELKLPGVCPITLEEFERDDEPLKIAKTNRSRVEYYFTCTPSLPLYVLNHCPEVDLITYIDADLFFFASPTPLFEEIAGRSIAIIGHRFPQDLKDLEIKGIYNVGWQSFRKDISGLACLQWWRDHCIEWCYDRVENGRYADQKYLDDWPTRFRNVAVLEHKGANVALWNLSNYHLGCQDGKRVTIDTQPLIFFHFSGLKKSASWRYYINWKEYRVRSSLVLRRRVYAPYIRTLFDVSRQLLSANMQVISGLIRRGTNQRERPIPSRYLIKQFRRLFFVCKNILTGQYIFIINGYII